MTVRFPGGHIALVSLLSFCGGALAVWYGRYEGTTPAWPDLRAELDACQAERAHSAAPVDVRPPCGAAPRAMSDALPAHAERDGGDPIAALLADGDHEQEAFSEAVDRLTASPDARAALITLLEHEPDGARREKLVALLAFVASADVERYAHTLTAAHDPARRREGYQVLAQQGSRAAQAATARALVDEREPRALAAAIQASERDRQPPTEVRSTVQRLRTLSEHEDAEVRAESLLALARWEKSSSVGEHLVRGLNDRASSVRQAAVVAITESGQRTELIKNELLRVATDDAADLPLRERAGDALRTFTLSEQEFAAVQDAL